MSLLFCAITVAGMLFASDYAAVPGCIIADAKKLRADVCEVDLFEGILWYTTAIPQLAAPCLRRCAMSIVAVARGEGLTTKG